MAGPVVRSVGDAPAYSSRMLPAHPQAHKGERGEGLRSFLRGHKVLAWSGGILSALFVIGTVTPTRVKTNAETLPRRLAEVAPAPTPEVSAGETMPTFAIAAPNRSAECRRVLNRVALSATMVSELWGVRSSFRAHLCGSSEGHDQGTDASRRSRLAYRGPAVPTRSRGPRPRDRGCSRVTVRRAARSRCARSSSGAARWAAQDLSQSRTKKAPDQHQQRERVTRIELALSAWEAEVLPLNYTRNST